MKYGITHRKYEQKSMSATAMSMYYGIVQPGLRNAENLFRGLKRDLWFDGDAVADRRVVAYAWLPDENFEYVDGVAHPRTPSPGNVFIALVRLIEKNEHGVSGTLDHWNWVPSDPKRPNAPEGWKDRYAEQLWI